MITETKTIQQAMSEMLAALGFDQMSKDVLGETETDRLQRYARVIVKNSKYPFNQQAANLFRLHRPRLY